MNPNHVAIDCGWARRELCLTQRLILWICRHPAKKFARAVISHAYERRIIGSGKLHALHAIADRILPTSSNKEGLK